MNHMARELDYNEAQIRSLWRILALVYVGVAVLVVAALVSVRWLSCNRANINVLHGILDFVFCFQEARMNNSIFRCPSMLLMYRQWVRLAV